MILESAIENGEGATCNIVCTQPRRIAAISVAHRVARERGEHKPGKTIGYQVRFETKLPSSAHGSMLFCTTGTVLRRLSSAMSLVDSDENMSPAQIRSRAKAKAWLESISHLIIDEVHERDMNTDFLITIVKRLWLQRRQNPNAKTFKLILMSATLDADLFRDYFADENGTPCPLVNIPGRLYHVKQEFLEDVLDYTDHYGGT